MKDSEVYSSVLNWFAGQYGGNKDYGPPTEFDPKKSSLTSWVQIQVDILDNPIRRRQGNKEVLISLLAYCWGRTQTNIYTAPNLASDVLDIVEHAVVDVKDFTTTDEEVVGKVFFREAKITNLSDEVKSEGWQCYRVEVDGLSESV